MPNSHEVLARAWAEVKAEGDYSVMLGFRRAVVAFYGAGSPFVARVEKLANKIADELLQHEEA
jgi:predicted metal-dependent hydrolase